MMNIKILLNSFKVLIAPVIVILMFKFFNYLELDSTDNNSYIYGLFLGAIIYIILNKRKKYVCDFKVKNDLYEIKYYNMFGLKKEISLSFTRQTGKQLKRWKRTKTDIPYFAAVIFCIVCWGRRLKT